MRFQMPETLDELTLTEVHELYEAALAEAHELNAIADTEITSEQTADLVRIVGFVQTLDERIVVLEAEVAPTAEEIAAARAALGVPAAEETEEVEEPEAEEDAEVEEPEAVLAGGARPQTFASRAARGRRQEEPPVDPQVALRGQSVSIRAAANVRGFSVDQELDLDQLAVAYVNRAKMFAGGGAGSKVGRKARAKAGSYTGLQLSAGHERYAVAKLQKPENEFTITEKMSAEDQFELIRRAASEKRLGGGSLVAAGGWCAPSEQIYGFLELESADGLLSLPEVTARRGGIQFTKGPQLGDLLLETNLGWDMTEAQVEAGATPKPIFDIDCPDWDEVRLRAVGYAIRAGLLTESAYPELVRRYLGLGLIVHARRMNAKRISGISTIIGTATAFAEVAKTAGNSSPTSDLLAAIELNAIRIREQYSMPLNSTVEGVFPLWVTAVIRSELSRRGDEASLISVPDSMIIGWFRDRKINPQFVRDYQGINSGPTQSTPTTGVAGGTTGWTKLPDAVEFMLYPAGSFVALGTDVIDLDTVYDVDNLTKNQFLAAFFEEGFAIANTGGSGVKVSVKLPNTYGLSGGLLIGA